MAKLYGAQKMVPQETLGAQGETGQFIEDLSLCQTTRISLDDMRNRLLTLDQEGLVDLALTNDGLSASITPKGRLTLGLFHPFPSDPDSAPADRGAFGAAKGVAAAL